MMSSFAPPSSSSFKVRSPLASPVVPILQEEEDDEEDTIGGHSYSEKKMEELGTKMMVSYFHT